jgi:hypothetical protein
VSDDGDPYRDALHEAIQKHAPTGQNAVLTGWALVAEWMDEDGDRWITKTHAAAVTHWTANGMYHEALHGPWPRDDDED